MNEEGSLHFDDQTEESSVGLEGERPRTTTLDHARSRTTMHNHARVSTTTDHARPPMTSVSGVAE